MERPCKATVIVPMHNHEAFVGAQLESLKSQWRTDIDLLVIDDGSSDRSADVAARFLSANGELPATMLRNRVSQHVGMIETVLACTVSPILIQADSDDICLPGRLDRILECFERDPRCRLVTSNAFKIDGDSVLGLLDVVHETCVFTDPFEAARKAGDVRCVGATSAMHRSILEGFPLDEGLCPFVFDQLSFMRAVLLGTHHYLSEPLIGWRQHGGNMHSVMGMNASDGEARERWLTLQIMALAQKIRDIEHVGHAFTDARYDQDLTTTAKDFCLGVVADWARVRNRLTYEKRGERRARAAMPPVCSLAVGQRADFGSGGRAGILAARWSGIHSPEAGFNWMAGQSVLVFRAFGATAIQLHLCGNWTGTAQRLELKAWKNFVLIGDATLDLSSQPSTVSLGFMQPQDADPITLHCRVNGASVPSEIDMGNTDTRQLGWRLFWIEPI